MPETWYVLQDGTPGDPAQIGPDSAGVLRHASGKAVAIGPHGPRSRSMSDAEIEAVRAAPPAADREMKPKRGGRYETR